MSDLITRINILIVHRERLEKSKSFEEFKSNQLSYIDWLIEYIMADQESIEYINKE